MPIAIDNTSDIPVEIKLNSSKKIAMVVSTDPAFRGRAQHERNISNLLPDLIFDYADERPEALELMKKTEPHVLYFFCHGGLVNNEPSIEVGSPKSQGITRETLRTERIRWQKTRPLVFLNFIHSNVLTSERAMGLISEFIDTSHASGVISPQITNFIPVARVFTEEFLHRFMVEMQSVGEAMRGASLAVLEQANPLGLQYIAYASSGLKIIS